MNITIKTIPHSEQRYPTVGDWWWSGRGKDELHIRVSEMKDHRYVWLIIIHELVEVFLCRNDGVKSSDVDEFDRAYEIARPEGDTSEPGDSPAAPYRTQHCIATGIERIIAGLLGVCWADYEKTINEL